MPFNFQLLVATVLLGVFFGWLTYKYKSQELVLDQSIKKLQHEERVLQEFSELIYIMQSKNVVTAQKYAKNDFVALRRHYKEQKEKCKKISKEVNKWGNKKKIILDFLQEN